jgi:hypothetical protein
MEVMRTNFRELWHEPTKIGQRNFHEPDTKSTEVRHQIPWAWTPTEVTEFHANFREPSSTDES